MAAPKKKKSLWAVTLSTSADRMSKKMPEKVQDSFVALLADIEEDGPNQKGWAHFSPLKKTKRVPEKAYHCHLKSGRPTYVACWQVNKAKKRVEVFYVGTHENAPYQ